VEELSLADARRIALAAQGFWQPRAADPDDLVAAVGRLGLVQLDSVNVLCRSHYLPLFSRLGRYDRSELDRVTGHGDQAGNPGNAGDRTAGLRLVEYWATTRPSGCCPPRSSRHRTSPMSMPSAS
jgi:uncharacterized protein